MIVPPEAEDVLGGFLGHADVHEIHLLHVAWKSGFMSVRKRMCEKNKASKRYVNNCLSIRLGGMNGWFNSMVA